MTPRTLILALKGARQRVERDIKMARTVAWYAAAPHWGKDFPKFDEFVNGKPKPVASVTVEDSMNLWFAVMNGVPPPPSP